MNKQAKTLLLSFMSVGMIAGIALGGVTIYGKFSSQARGWNIKSNSERDFLLGQKYSDEFQYTMIDASGGTDEIIGIYIPPHSQTSQGKNNHDYGIVIHENQEDPVNDFVQNYKELNDFQYPIFNIKSSYFNFDDRYLSVIKADIWAEFVKWYIGDSTTPGHLSFGPEAGVISTFEVLPGIEEKSNGAITLGGYTNHNKENGKIAFYPDAFFGSLPLSGVYGADVRDKLGDFIFERTHVPTINDDIAEPDFTIEQIGELLDFINKKGDWNNLHKTQFNEIANMPSGEWLDGDYSKNGGNAPHPIAIVPTRTVHKANGDEPRFKLFAELYPAQAGEKSLLEKVAKKYPELQNKSDGYYIVKDNQGNYSYAKGPHREWSPTSRIGFPQLLDSINDDFEGVDIEFLKYVSVHEFGHLETTIHTRDVSEGGVVAGSIHPKRPINAESYVNLESLNMYLAARSHGLRVEQVNPYGQPYENNQQRSASPSPFFRFLMPNGNLETQEEIVGVYTYSPENGWELAARDQRGIYRAFHGTLQGLLDDYVEPYNHLHPNHETTSYNAFLMNSFDNISGTMNPEFDMQFVNKVADIESSEDIEFMPKIADNILQVISNTDAPITGIGWFKEMEYWETRGVPKFLVSGTSFRPVNTNANGEDNGLGMWTAKNIKNQMLYPLTSDFFVTTKPSTPDNMTFNFFDNSAIDFSAIPELVDDGARQAFLTAPSGEFYTKIETILKLTTVWPGVSQERKREAQNMLNTISPLLNGLRIANDATGDNGQKGAVMALQGIWFEANVNKMLGNENIFYDPNLGWVSARNKILTIRDWNPNNQNGQHILVPHTDINTDADINLKDFGWLANSGMTLNNEDYQFDLIDIESLYLRNGETLYAREHALDPSKTKVEIKDQFLQSTVLPYVLSLIGGSWNIQGPSVSNQEGRIAGYATQGQRPVETRFYMSDYVYTYEEVMTRDFVQTTFTPSFEDISSSGDLRINNGDSSYEVFISSRYTRDLNVNDNRVWFSAAEADIWLIYLHQEALADQAFMNSLSTFQKSIYQGMIQRRDPDDPKTAFPYYRVLDKNRENALNFLLNSYFGKNRTITNGFERDRQLREVLNWGLYDHDGSSRMILPTDEIEILSPRGDKATTWAQAYWYFLLGIKGVGQQSVSGLYRDSVADKIYTWGYMDTAHGVLGENPEDRPTQLAFRNKETNIINYQQIYYQDQDDMFYFVNQGDESSRYTLGDEHFIAWSTNKFTAGQYVNEDLIQGEYEVYFANQDGSRSDIPFTLGSREFLSENGKLNNQAPTFYRSEVDSSVTFVVRERFNGA